MKKLLISFIILIFMAGSSAYSIPNLQLFVDGGTYDTDTQTWVVSGSSFNLYVIGANRNYDDVLVSMALNYPQSSNPNGAVSIDVDGTTYNSWNYGFAPMSSASTWDNSSDLSRHGVFPAWFAEFNAGDFGQVGGIGDVQPQPTYWNPALEGYLSGSNAIGEIKVFSINITGEAHVHFDAYTLDENGAVQYFAPFSHDVTAVPEPASFVLLGMGAIGFAIRRRCRK